MKHVESQRDRDHEVVEKQTHADVRGSKGRRSVSVPTGHCAVCGGRVEPSAP